MKTGDAQKLNAGQDPLKGMTLATPSDPDAVVVDVDGVKLTEKELSEQLARLSRGAKIPENMLEQMREQAIQVFISETLILNEADRQQIVVTQDDMEDALGDMRERLPEGVSLEDALAQRGSSLEEFKQEPQFLRQLRMKKVLELQTAGLEAPSEEVVKSKYEENVDHFGMPESVIARHILVRCDTDEDPAARQEKRDQAESIRKKLLEGEDFSELAKKHSDCPSGQRGGDLGTFRRGQMVKIFEDAAFTQNVDEIGPVVETDFGFHVIQVQEHLDERTLTLDEVHDDIVEAILREAREPIVRDFIENLKSRAMIRYGDQDQKGKSLEGQNDEDEGQAGEEEEVVEEDAGEEDSGE